MRGHVAILDYVAVSVNGFGILGLLIEHCNVIVTELSEHTTLDLRNSKTAEGFDRSLHE